MKRKLEDWSNKTAAMSPLRRRMIEEMTIRNLLQATVVRMGWRPSTASRTKPARAVRLLRPPTIQHECIDDEGDMDEALPGGGIGQLPAHGMSRAGAGQSVHLVPRQGRAVSGSVVFIFGRQ